MKMTMYNLKVSIFNIWWGRVFKIEYVFIDLDKKADRKVVQDEGNHDDGLEQP